jgi:hypothetical protein
VSALVPRGFVVESAVWEGVGTLITVRAVRQPTAAMQAPFGTVIQVILEAFTERSVSAVTYDAAVSLLGVPLLIDLITLAGTYARTAALLAVFDMQLVSGETHLLPKLSV